MSFKKWGVYCANLDPVIGSEQRKSRPVIVISEDTINVLLNVVNVLPVTTRKGERMIYPNETLLGIADSGLPNESVALCYQIRTLDKKRLSTQLGMISSKAKQEEILEALCFQ